MSGEKENRSWPEKAQDTYQGETLQLFVFFKGRYLGYQCYVQDRVTAGGSQNLDLYLPACDPEDGYWSFEICGGTLLAWLSPLGGGTCGGSKPVRRAVEPLDVFPLGPYRLQVKILRAAGFDGQYADLAAKPAGAGSGWAAPATQEAQAEPEPLCKDSGTISSKTRIQDSHRQTAPFQGTYLEETLEGLWSSPAEATATFADSDRAIRGLPQDGAGFEPDCDCPSPSPPVGAFPEPASEVQPSCDRAPSCRERAHNPAEDVQPLEAAGVDPSGPLPCHDPKEGGEESDPESESFTDDADGEAARQTPYFSPLREIFRSCKTAMPIADPARRALEIVRFRGADLRDAACLEGEGAYRLRENWTRNLWKMRGGPRPNSRLVSLAAGGRALVHLPDGVTGRLHSRSGSRDLRELIRPSQPRGREGRLRPGHSAPSVELAPDAWAVLRVDPDRYLVRHVERRPALPTQPLRPRMSRSQAKILSASVVSHIVLILLVGLTVPQGTIGGQALPDRFAKIDPTVLKTFKKPEPPKPDRPLASPLPQPQSKPKAVPKREPSTRPPEAAKTPSRFQQAHPSSAVEPRAEPPKEVDVSQTGLLAALGSPSPAGADAKGSGQSQILLAAVTNLDAVTVPADSTTFNLAGIAGKLGTSEIQVPTGGGEAIRTVGAQELLRNSQGTVGALASKGTGSGQIKAIVREPPKATISIRGGMSREAVLQVVNAHLDEIRDCYERELLHSPGLTGKIVLEWLIREDGSVSYAKVAFTNIGHSSDLHLCVQAQVAAWKFPKPTDGHEVVVTFPFLFENMGF